VRKKCKVSIKASKVTLISPQHQHLQNIGYWIYLPVARLGKGDGYRAFWNLGRRKSIGEYSSPERRVSWLNGWG
jgi:hypothetical protein